MDLTPPGLFSLSGQNILITGATRGNTSSSPHPLSLEFIVLNKRNRGSMRTRTSSSRCSFHLSCPKTAYTRFTFQHVHSRNHQGKMPFCPCWNPLLWPRWHASRKELIPTSLAVHGWSDTRVDQLCWYPKESKMCRVYRRHVGSGQITSSPPIMTSSHPLARSSKLTSNPFSSYLKPPGNTWSPSVVEKLSTFVPSSLSKEDSQCLHTLQQKEVWANWQKLWLTNGARTMYKWTQFALDT